MVKHNMIGMDAASKLLMALPDVLSDLVDFALRKIGFKVVRGSLRERNPEAIAQLRKQKSWYRKVCNDAVTELEVTDGDVTATMLVLLENQSCASNVMAGRNLLATGARWDCWRREMKRIHQARKELHSSQELLDGVLPGDRMTPFLTLVVHFGQEPWTGRIKFTDTLDCPRRLKPMLAECPANVVSFYNLSEAEIDEMPPGALRAVAKSIHYAQQPEKLLHEWLTDPSFKPPRLDEMLDVIAIATGMNSETMKQLKDEDMGKTVSALGEYFISKGVTLGRVEGEAKTVQKFIRNRRNRHIPESQILQDLKSDFEMDEAKARQYMEAELVKA